MTNEQAFNIASICGVLTNSKQLSFGVIRILNKNAKIANSINLEIKEIYDLAKSSQQTDETLKDELQKHKEEEFKGEFAKLKSSFLFDVKSEEIDFNNATLGGKPFDTRFALEILDEQNLIED